MLYTKKEFLDKANQFITTWAFHERETSMIPMNQDMSLVPVNLIAPSILKEFIDFLFEDDKRKEQITQRFLKKEIPFLK